MRLALRIAAITGGVLAVGAIALVLRALSTAGIFTDVTPGFAGTCQTIGHVPGPADIAVDRRADLAFIAAAERRPGRSRKSDGLYLFRIAHPELGLARIAGAPKDFHPSGLSLFRGPHGALTLITVNRREQGGTSLDIFGLAVTTAADSTVTAHLSERASVRSSLFTRARDVAAAGEDRFYLADAPEAAMSFATLLAAPFAPADGNIVYFDGQVSRVVAKDVSYANGLALSRDGTKLYVTTTLGRELRTYDVGQLTGSLTLQSTYSLPAALDHVDVDAQGALWVAGQPQLFAFDDYSRDARHPSPSQIFRVTTTAEVPEAFKRVYTGLGGRIGAASVAVFAGGHLLIGAALDDKLLDCTPR